MSSFIIIYLLNYRYCQKDAASFSYLTFYFNTIIFSIASSDSLVDIADTDIGIVNIGFG